MKKFTFESKFDLGDLVRVAWINEKLEYMVAKTQGKIIQIGFGYDGILCHVRSAHGTIEVFHEKELELFEDKNDN